MGGCKLFWLISGFELANGVVMMCEYEFSEKQNIFYIIHNPITFLSALTHLLEIATETAATGHQKWFLACWLYYIILFLLIILK